MDNKGNAISFEWKDKTYTLAFTADSIKRMDQRGFNFADLESHILTAAEDLFIGSFEAYHKNVPVSERKEIFVEFANEDENGTELLEVLAELASEALEEIMNPHKGNIKWRIVKR